MARYKALLKDAPDGIVGKVIGDHIVIDVAPKDVHYWSPQLNFRVEEQEDEPDSAIVAGLIGPRPEVWTLFVFIYFVIGVSGFFISSYGIVEYSMGRPSKLIYGFPITFLLLLSAYRVSKYGESLASDQMALFKEFVNKGLMTSA